MSEMLLFCEVDYCLTVLLRHNARSYNRLFPSDVDNLVGFAFDTCISYFLSAPPLLLSSIRNSTRKSARIVTYL